MRTTLLARARRDLHTARGTTPRRAKGEIYVVGTGPTQWSTSVALQHWPLTVWDTNHYYADLGVATDATRVEIRRAYQERQGSASVRLTFVVRQLLHREIRRRYDATPLGHLFLDAEVAERVRLAALDKPACESVTEVLDTTNEDGQAGEQVSPGWPWAHYRWDVDHQHDDDARLAEWQEALIRSLAAEGVSVHVGLGIKGDKTSPCDVVAVGRRIVVFLRLGERPTEETVHAVASRVMNHLSDRT